MLFFGSSLRLLFPPPPLFPRFIWIKYLLTCWIFMLVCHLSSIMTKLEFFTYLIVKTIHSEILRILTACLISYLLVCWWVWIWWSWLIISALYYASEVIFTLFLLFVIFGDCLSDSLKLLFWFEVCNIDWFISIWIWSSRIWWIPYGWTFITSWWLGHICFLVTCDIQ